MRISAHITVAGKMLFSRARAIFFDAPNESRGEIGHLFRLLAERADIDDWVRGVVIHICVGCKYPVDPGGASLERGIFSSCVCKFRIIRRTNCHRRREIRALVETHACTALKISSNQERHFGMCLERVHDYGRWIYLAAFNSKRTANRPEDKSPNVILFNLVQQIPICRTLYRLKNSEVVGHQHLPELFANGHFSQRGFHPCGSASGGAILLGRRLLGAGGRCHEKEQRDRGKPECLQGSSSGVPFWRLHPAAVYSTRFHAAQPSLPADVSFPFTLILLANRRRSTFCCCAQFREEA